MPDRRSAFINSAPDVLFEALQTLPSTGSPMTDEIARTSWLEIPR
jgi:hypothetical protein